MFGSSAEATLYSQTNLVSNISGLAAVTDTDLVNPWGIASGGSGPIWVANNGTDLSTIYDGNTGVKQGLVVSLPSGTAPTGIVSNSTASFNGNLFLFAGQNGSITGWRGALGTAAETDVPASAAVYTGLAIGSASGNDFLYAADFAGAKIDAFNSAFGPGSLPGTFTDAGLPAGYAPFGIQNIGGKIYVAYAVVDPSTGDELAGPGNGIVDAYDTSGTFLQRVFTGGVLNAPWGITLAPADFGQFSGDLLVGNFGDGTINAFDPSTGDFQGTLLDQLGDPIVNHGLWGLAFGNGGDGGPANALFFNAGINDEADGLFGRIQVAPTPEPLTTTLLLLAGAAGMMRATARRR